MSMVTNILLCFPREDRPCVLFIIIILFVFFAFLVAISGHH